MFSRLVGQVSSGLILGLTAVIYAVSYAALIFAGSLATYIPYALTITLITAAIGGLYGLFSEESTLVSGPDSNTTSVLAGILVAAAAAPLPGVDPLHRALVIVFAATVVTGLLYLLMERFNAGKLVRFIPFQVMAGFLASTGWLMSSGALNLIAGTPLTLNGALSLIEEPRRPELAVGIALGLALFWLNGRFRAAVVIPVFMVVVSVVINLATRVGFSGSWGMDLNRWFFQPFDRLQWLPPWSLDFTSALLFDTARLLPSFLVVAFVGALTVLLSLSSLELTYKRDFGLEPSLRLHGVTTLFAAAIGGYIGLISIGRSTMCRSTGGGRWTGLVIAAVCVGMLMGMGLLIAWIPKVALGALVLYLGLGMLKQWVWDLRRRVSRAELLEVIAIVMCVALFGYVIGFAAGLLMACIIFVVNYSRMPHIRTDTTLVHVRSSVIRPVTQQELLSVAGAKCRVGRFDGYIFFGVANSIYEWYSAAAPGQFTSMVLDFSLARGMDPSAVAVIKKIIRTESSRQKPLIVALSAENKASFADVSAAGGSGELSRFAGTFDEALEIAEELILAKWEQPETNAAKMRGESVALGFIGAAADREAFKSFLSRHELSKGDVLFEEGATSVEIYFLERGRLDVVKRGLRGATVRLAKVMTGSTIGEMALYSGQPRAATVIATETALLFGLNHAGWQRLKTERPDLAAELDRYVIAGLINNVSRSNANLAVNANWARSG